MLNEAHESRDVTRTASIPSAKTHHSPTMSARDRVLYAMRQEPTRRWTVVELAEATKAERRHVNAIVIDLVRRRAIRRLVVGARHTAGVYQYEGSGDPSPQTPTAPRPSPTERKPEDRFMVVAGEHRCEYADRNQALVAMRQGHEAGLKPSLWRRVPVKVRVTIDVE